MDSEEKKPQFDEKAMWQAMWQEIDDLVEQEMREAEEEEMNPSVEDDDIDRLEWEHKRREMALLDIVESMQADYESSESESEEDSDEDEEEDEDEERKSVGGKA
jgi:hypothetical protein